MASDISLKSVMYKNPKVVGQTVEQEVVLILLEKNQVKVLNEVGSRIWELVDGERTIADIACEICNEFEVTLDQAQEDALVFLDELLFKGIVCLSE